MEYNSIPALSYALFLVKRNHPVFQQASCEMLTGANNHFIFVDMGYDSFSARAVVTVV